MSGFDPMEAPTPSPEAICRFSLDQLDLNHHHQSCIVLSSSPTQRRCFSSSGYILVNALSAVQSLAITRRSVAFPPVYPRFG